MMDPLVALVAIPIHHYRRQCQSLDGGMGAPDRTAHMSVAITFVVPSDLDTRPVTFTT